MQTFSLPDERTTYECLLFLHQILVHEVTQKVISKHKTIEKGVTENTMKFAKIWHGNPKHIG